MLRSLLLVAVLFRSIHSFASLRTRAQTRGTNVNPTALGHNTWFRQNLINEMEQREQTLSEVTPPKEQNERGDFYPAKIEEAMKPLEDAIRDMEAASSPETEAVKTMESSSRPKTASSTAGPIIMGPWFRRNMIQSQPSIVATYTKEAEIVNVEKEQPVVNNEPAQRALLTARLDMESKNRALEAAKEVSMKAEATHRALLSARLETEANSRALEAAKEEMKAVKEANMKAEAAQRALLTTRLEMEANGRALEAREREMKAAMEANMKAEAAQRALLATRLEMEANGRALEAMKKASAKKVAATRALMTARFAMETKERAMTGAVTVCERGMIQKWCGVEEKKRAAKYGAIDCIEERAFTVVQDLKLVNK